MACHMLNAFVGGYTEVCRDSLLKMATDLKMGNT